MGSIFDDAANLGKHLDLRPASPLLHTRARQPNLVIGRYTRFSLTVVGKRKSDSLFTSSSLKQEVLSYIAEEGSANKTELEEELGISSNKAEALLKMLLRQQYIRPSDDRGQ